MAVRSVVGIVGAAISGPGMIRGDGSSPQGGISFVHTAGAGVGLFPNGLFPLYELGLRDQLDAISCEMESLSVWRGFPDGSHKFLNNVKNAGWAADLQTCPRIVERQRLRMMLLERFQDLGGEVCWNKKLAGLESLGSAGVRAVFTDGVSKNVDLIIGADGVWSTVRKHILKERNPKTAELRWVPPFVRVGGIYGISSDPGAVPDSNSQKLGASKEACLVLLDQGHIGALPLEDGKIAWTIQYTEKHAPERTTPIQKEEISMSDPYQSKVVPGLYEPHSTAEFVRGYENIWHPTLGSFRPLFEASERIIRSPLRQFAWEQNEIQCGNVAVIGDAARVVPPYAGQGKSLTTIIEPLTCLFI
ncbi:uncharacterized protein KY384_007151 [Bacidia gigantensis]|uniref:uncharacterized protein n=1 Tax=Bacidia gigantensis TaxID=2732470 RepID=UPI001D0431E3|nr:uncharacterized protein KY384_007151 [Bacidia gigantensis]KAG8528234.1 hypothetical protein KY384_007151 [Bacidia gigantensis]